jgi:pimeloyl-ACP methyl ester carboxylesterase
MQENEPEPKPQDTARLDDAILRIHAGKMKVPPEQQMDYLRSEIAKLPAGPGKTAIEITFLSTQESMERQVRESEIRVQQRETAKRRRWPRLTLIRAVIVLVLLVGVVIFALNKRLIPVGRSPFEVHSGYFGGDKHKPIAVVFVHGIFGTRQDTWQNGGSSFPGLLATDPVLSAKVDVFLFEYFTPNFGSAASIVGLADDLRGSLDDYRVFEDHQRVVFVVHSMGGLVLRQFLLTKRDRLSKVPMLYFFATPTDGSELTEAAKALSSNPQLRGMLPLEDNDLLQSIQSQWRGWDKAKETPSYCAYETLPTAGVMVVKQSSAIALCNQDLDPMAANHIDIVKPQDRDDPRYARFASALRKYANIPASAGTTHHAAKPGSDPNCTKRGSGHCLVYKYPMTFESVATEPGAKNWHFHPSDLPANTSVTISWDGSVTSAEHPQDPQSVEIVVLIDSPNAPKNCAWQSNETCGGHHNPSGAWTHFHLEKEATSGPNGELDAIFSLNFCGGTSAHCTSNDGTLSIRTHK